MEDEKALVEAILDNYKAGLNDLHVQTNTDTHKVKLLESFLYLTLNGWISLTTIVWYWKQN